MSKKVSKTLVYSWAAYMWTHQPEEMKLFLKHGTPSETLIKLAENPIAMTMSDGKFKAFAFPQSLNSSTGQKTLYNALVNVKKYVYTIPIQAFATLEDIKTNLSVRRSDAKANTIMVAEAILHRAATEFKHEVLFAFDSINVWINTKYGKELGYLTIRKALEVLVEQKFIKVNEWGKRGNRSKCTKIEFLPKEYILTYTSTLDDWLLFSDHAMTAVYRRESTTRQDVLEARFQTYIDELQEESVVEQRVTEFLSSGRKLFKSPRVTIVEQEETIVSEENIDVEIDRFLGGLVSAVQEDGSYSGEVRSSVRRKTGSVKDRC